MKIVEFSGFTIRVAASRQDSPEEVKSQKKIHAVSCRFLIVVFFCFCYNNASINRKEELFYPNVEQENEKVMGCRTDKSRRTALEACLNP